MRNDNARFTEHRVAIMNLLCMHPAVREAAVIHNNNDGLAAFVVLEDSYLDEVMGRETSATNVIIKWRKACDLSQLTKEAGSVPVGFNISGWNSSYTRQPIPSEQMLEWVETTVADILRLGPKSIYEIGCGTGMLLMRIVPHLDRYVGVDFSRVVLEKLRMQLRAVPWVANRVEIFERTANDFDAVAEQSVDTVVLNSVVQYFPNATYLTRVLEKAINIVRPGGRVFVGDVRNLALLSPFASSVEIFQAEDEVRREDLRSRVRRRIEREQEVVISPAYFVSLQGRYSKVSRVEISPRYGFADNEMTRYRYNAVLHVGREPDASHYCEFVDWKQQKWTLDEIRSLLRRRPRGCLGIMRIQNARLEGDLATLAAINDVDASYTAGEIRHKLKQNIGHGIHPQALIDLGREDLGFAVFLSWAACRPDGSFDVCFIPTELQRSVTMPAIDWPKPEPAAFVQLTNAPGQGKIRKELVSLLFAHCRQNLPGGMVPSIIALVDALVRNSDGTVDSSALLTNITRATI